MTDIENQIILTPIGFIRSELKYRYETPRQGILANDLVSVVELLPHNNFEQAVQNLDGFEKIWIIYQFHLNSNWKPLVSPPRHTRKKIGVFATRAPYRPNQIGISCVNLIKVDKLKIYINGSDILDGSPVLDIKPYLPYSDSFPNARTGWAQTNIAHLFDVVFEDEATRQIDWLKRQANINLQSFARLQLEFNPADDSRKRITKNFDGYILAYRTWRIHYLLNNELNKVHIQKISSGYSIEELTNTVDDKYKDKELHKKFIRDLL